MNRCSQCDGEIAGSGTTCGRCDSLGEVPLSLDNDDAFNFDAFIAEPPPAAAPAPVAAPAISVASTPRPLVLPALEIAPPAPANAEPGPFKKDTFSFDDFIAVSTAAAASAPTAPMAPGVAPKPPVTATAPEGAPEVDAFAIDTPLPLDNDDALTFDDSIRETPAAAAPTPAAAPIAPSVAKTLPPVAAAASEVARQRAALASEAPLSLEDDDALTFGELIPETPAAARSAPSIVQIASSVAPTVPAAVAAAPAVAPTAPMAFATAEGAPTMPALPVVAQAAARGANRRVLLAALLVVGGGTLTFAMLRSSAPPAVPVTTSKPVASKPAASKPAAPKAVAPKPVAPAPAAAASAAPVTGPRWTAANGEWLLNKRKGVAFQLPALKKVTIWQGVAHPMLVLRCDAGRMQMFVYTASAIRMEPEDQNHTVRVSVDGQNEAIERWADSSDHDALFVPDATAMARRLTTASTLRIGYTPHNAQPVVAEFQVGGFNEVLGPAAKPCGWKK